MAHNRNVGDRLRRSVSDNRQKRIYSSKNFPQDRPNFQHAGNGKRADLGRSEAGAFSAELKLENLAVGSARFL